MTLDPGCRARVVCGLTWCLVAGVLGPGRPARATQGGTISNGDVTFGVTIYGEDPRADLTGFSPNLATDHVYRSGWWYRFAGDTSETPFPPPDTPESWSGSIAELDWADLDGSGLLEAHETIGVADLGSAPDTGYVSRSLTVHNPNDAPVDVDLIHFADIDLGGNLNDSAALVEYTPQRIIELADTGGLIGSFNATWSADVPPSAVTHRVTAYDTLRSLLNDAAITTIGSTGLPFGPGDLTAAYQFRLSVPPHADQTVTVWILIGLSVRCGAWGALFCDGFENGSTSIWSAKQP